MTTTKSYLAGLGMTGIVIGSVLVLLAVGTGLVAFDGAPDVGGQRAPLDRVVVGKGARSAGAHRGHKRPDVHPAPATGTRVPVARPPAAVEGAPGTARSPETGRDPRTRAEHGHGGVQARTPGSLGGGAPVRDASEDGGGAGADGPRGRAKRGAGPPPGHGGAPAPSTKPAPSREAAPGKDRAPGKDSAPDKDPGRVVGHWDSLGPALGHVKHDVGNAVDRDVAPGLLP